MNAVFGLRSRLSIGEELIVAVLVSTSFYIQKRQIFKVYVSKSDFFFFLNFGLGKKDHYDARIAYIV